MIFPLKEISFGEIKIKAPAQPDIYLDFEYTKSWSEKIKVYKSHLDGFNDLNKKHAKTQNLNKENCRPAGPFGPLKNNVS